MNWYSIETAPTDGTKIIGRAGNKVRTTWRASRYEKFPHQEGGPTFRYEWDYEEPGTIFSWRPTHWAPLEPLPARAEEGGRER